MSEKELLYIEDAVSHENIIIKYLEENIDLLDEEFVSYFEEEIKEHTSLRNKLMSSLEEALNE